MKLKLIPIPVAAGVLLAATLNLQALPPRQHSVSGVIKSVDCASRTITLKSESGAAPLTFVWNDTTRFSRKGGCARCGLDSGQAVCGWYRREVGQNVIREVGTNPSSSKCVARR